MWQYMLESRCLLWTWPGRSERNISTLSSQSLQDEAEGSEGRWVKLQEVVGKLKDRCPSVAEIMEEKCQSTHARYALRSCLNNSRYLYLPVVG